MNDLRIKGWENFRPGSTNRPSHNQSSAGSLNANGVPSQSPGLPRSGYPGSVSIMLHRTPTGLRPRVGCVGGTPLGFDALGRTLPRVGARASRQPWALRRNAVGVRRLFCDGSPHRSPNQIARPNAGGRFHFRSRGRRHWPGVVQLCVGHCPNEDSDRSSCCADLGGGCSGIRTGLFFRSSMD